MPIDFSYLIQYLFLKIFFFEFKLKTSDGKIMIYFNEDDNYKMEEFFIFDYILIKNPHNFSKQSPINLPNTVYIKIIWLPR